METFDELFPKVGDIVRIKTKDGFVMETRVRCRYVSYPFITSPHIILDVADTPTTSLPINLEYNKKGKWEVKHPEKCPYYKKEVEVDWPI